MTDRLVVRSQGLVGYQTSYDAMLDFTENRTAETIDELWLLEHTPVFTQGRAGKAEHLLHTGDIQVVQSDRGGQVTYHGPGQLTAYVLVDLKRKGINVRELVSAIENSIVNALAPYGISAFPKPDAPGVYVADAKIASLGLRIRKGCSFHGLALNIDMDMEPFLRINPCGYAGMQMTQVSNQTNNDVSVAAVAENLVKSFSEIMDYDDVEYCSANLG